MRKMRKGILFFILCLTWAPVASAIADSPKNGIGFLESAQTTFIDLAKRVTPSVVYIAPMTDSRGILPHGERRDKDPAPPAGSGSGVIVDKEGFIVTNNHVVTNAKEVKVRLADKTEFTGKVIGQDTDTDLAVIKIEADRDLPFVALGNSEKVQVGQWVMAVGNPFGLEQTVTIGIVSGLGRENVHLSRYENFIQTDASINPGNSGGPLFNIYGEVIGINTAIINVAQGIGFAIPSDMVKAITQQLMTAGTVKRGWLGVGIQQFTATLAKKFNVKEDTGILVNEVFEGNPAAQSGMQPGDIITHVNGTLVNTTSTLARIIAGFSPGEEVDVQFLRQGQTQKLKIKLAEKKDDATLASLPPPERFMGLLVEDITPEHAKKFNLKSEKEKGVVILEVDDGSPAESAGLKAGDLITEMESEPISNINDFKKVAEKVETAETVLLRTNRENRSFYIVVEQKAEDEK